MSFETIYTSLYINTLFCSQKKTVKKLICLSTMYQRNKFKDNKMEDIYEIGNASGVFSQGILTEYIERKMVEKERRMTRSD